MAAGKRRYTNEPSRDTDRRRQLYVYGNAVPKPEFVPERQQEVPGRQRKTSAQVKKNRNRARQINPAYVMFLAVATVIAVVVCIHYLQLRAELTQHSRQITALQEELNDLTEKNDTAYSAAEDSVNLEELEETFHFDDHTLWDNCTGEKGKKTREKWNRLLSYTAANRQDHRKRRGSQKGDQREDAGPIRSGRYDYKKFLRQFSVLREEVELDTESFDYIFYNYGMEHYGNLPLIEPLEYKEVNRLEELVIAIDTSGSCDGETVRRFLEETYSILSEKENFFHKMKVYLIQCDCCIQDVKVIHSEEEWKEYSKDITIQGRGGTDFRPVFRYVKEQQEKKEIRRLKALIYFTDGDGIYPGSKPDYETAFVFLHKTEKMELVPPWAIRLVAEQEGVRHNI